MRTLHAPVALCLLAVTKRLEDLLGVRAASFTDVVPLGLGSRTSNVNLPGEADPLQRRMRVEALHFVPGYADGTVVSSRRMR